MLVLVIALAPWRASPAMEMPAVGLGLVWQRRWHARPITQGQTSSPGGLAQWLLLRRRGIFFSYLEE